VTDLGNGKYGVEVTAYKAGEYQLELTLGEEHIKGSPFDMVCT